MSTGVKFTKSGIPVPLDSSGNEMCLLFIKYGRCRFKKKCRKSHWTPPLPDEDYPKPPPLPPLSPPLSSFDSCSSTERRVTSQLSHEQQPHSQGLSSCPKVTGRRETLVTRLQRQNPPAIETSYNQEKHTVYLEHVNTGRTSTDSGLPISQGPLDSQHLLNQDVLEFSTQDQTFKVMQPLDIHQDIHNDTDPSFTTNKLSSMSPAFISNIKDQIVNTAKEVNDVESTVVEFTAVDANLTTQGLEKAVDRLVQVIYKGKCRFDYVYHPNRQAKGGSGWEYKSSVDQSYNQYGAYYDHGKEKLQVTHQPQNKVEKKRLKLLRKTHWNTCQGLKARLAQLPPSYSLKVNFAQVNFSRLRPYFYLLVQQCFFCVDPAETRWRPSAFSCLVADTLIAFFTNCNITPVEAEKRMQEWGVRPVRARQCISHMWNIIVKSSLSTAGVAQEVENCEKQVFAKKLCAVDYAYACSLAGPLMKGHVNKPTPAITKSVRQGIQAARNTASLLDIKQKRINLKSLRVSGNVYRSRIKTAAVETTSTTLDDGAAKTKGVSRKKKRRTRRSRQTSLLDAQGKQDLQKRCKAILGNAMDCV